MAGLSSPPSLVPQRVILSIVLVLLAAALPAAPARRAPKILLIYATAETTTSAQVIWNTDIAADTLLQYSTTNPVPATAPRVFSATQVSYHEVQLEGLAPGTLYYYKATSCTPKRGCVSATGSFDTFPTCPDEVPPVSGGWQEEDTPNRGEAVGADNELLAVTALAADEAWAVGWSQDPAGPPFHKLTLVERFDGASWKLVPSPNPAGAVSSVLHAVSGAASDDVWAVGVSHDGTLPSRTLIEHWDGVAWRIVPSPSPDSQLNELLGVAVVSATDAWAVGFRGGTRNETPLETLVLRWNGVDWTQVPSPSVPGGANQLFGVTALAPDEVWAVGFAGGSPLAMRWNGSVWSVVPVEGDGGLGSEWLTAIAGTSGDDLWAVGQGRGVFSNRSFATLRHWDGVHWTQKVCRARSASNPPEGYEGGGPDAYFTGISAAASDDVWAVGVVGSGPFILHWDGTAWTQVTHPRAFPSSAVLRGVATTSAGDVWAVGRTITMDPSGTTTTERTLVHRYVP